MVEVTSHSINPPTEDTLADIKILINSRIPLLVGGKVPVDISTSVGSMNVNAFPTANLGQQPVANSLSVTPASDIADPTYIGDIRFGEALPVGDNVIGKVKIDQAIPGTTNLVNVNGGPSQTADIKVTLDSETIAVTGPLTDAQLSAQSLAKDSSLTNILNKIIAEPSTEAKQDLILTALGLIATEATADDIKTAVEALVVATPDTAAGDLADINAASASIDGKLPALVGGKIPVDASVSIDPAGLATEATADDIKTAVEALVVATPDTAAGDLADINAAAASIDGKLPALVGGKIPVDASVSIDPAGLATEATLGTMQADIALMKADLAAILAILES